MQVTLTGAASAPLVGAAPLTYSPAFGFSTALVIDATADAVRDSVGWRREDSPWRFVAPCRGMRFGVMRHRVQSEYSLELSGGTIGLTAKQSVYDSEASPLWSFTRQVQGILWGDDAAELEEKEGSTEQPARVITEWSRRSRARMVRAIAEINHDTWTAEGTLGMVTLTLPGQWLHVAPSGADFKKMLRSLRWRWERQIGPWQTVWKLEFQGRGAPHYHLMMRVPAVVTSSRYGTEPFESWLSRNWAEVVGSDNTWCTDCAYWADLCDCVSGFEGTEFNRHLAAGTNVDLRANTTDPKRIAVYFLKHSSKTQDNKEYQHVVPKAWRVPGLGPGRFWGIAGLERHRAVVELDRQTWVELRRILRGVHRGARARTALARRARHLGDMGESARQSTLADLRGFGLRPDRILRSMNGGGWVLSNDAPALLFKAVQSLLAARHSDRFSACMTPRAHKSMHRDICTPHSEP